MSISLQPAEFSEEREEAMREAILAGEQNEDKQAKLCLESLVEREQGQHDVSKLQAMVVGDENRKSHRADHKSHVPNTHTERTQFAPGGVGFEVVDSERRDSAQQGHPPAIVEKVSAIVASVEAAKGGMAFDVLSPSAMKAEKPVTDHSESEEERRMRFEREQIDAMRIKSPQANRGGISFDIVDASQSGGTYPTVVLGPGALPSVSNVPSGPASSGAIPMANFGANSGGLSFDVVDPNKPVAGSIGALYAASHQLKEL